MNRKVYIFEKLTLTFLKALISVIFMAEAGYCWYKYFKLMAPTPYGPLGAYFIYALILVAYVYITNIYGGFNIGTSTVSDVILSQVISILVWQTVCYALFSLVSFKLLNVGRFFIMFVLSAVFAALWALISDRIYFVLHKPKKTLVVYNNVDSYLSLKGIKSMDRRFNVVKTVNSDDVTLEEVYGILEELDAVFLCGIPSTYRNEIVKYCITNKKVVYVKPKISDTIIRGGRELQLLNVSVYRCARSGNSLMYLFIKRLFDIVFSLFFIILTSPIMLVTAVAIKLCDGGSVFYKQPRYTKDKKIFNIIKFRSMKENNAKNGEALITKENDDRITPVGKIIRKLRIDELPQFFNILGGSMSVVGPRPEWVDVVDEYEKTVPEFALRLQVKAGLTGYAQIYGKYNTPPYDKVQMDLIYINNQSVIEDIKLMLLTFKIIFVSESTEGVEEGQTNAVRNTENAEL